MNQKYVDQLRAQTKQKVYRVPQSPGLNLMVGPSGTKTYYMRYTFEGRREQLVLGDAKDLTLAQAIDITRDHKYHLAKGIPPKVRHEYIPVSRAIKQWFVEHRDSLTANTIRSYKSSIDAHIVPALGKMDIRKVKRMDVYHLHKALASTPMAANAVLIVLTVFFSWAVEAAEYVESSPVKRIKAYKRSRRERTLSHDERTSLLEALTACDNQEFADAIRVLLITGSRKNEIVGLRWDGVDMENGVLRIDSKTGMTTRFLTSTAKQILLRQPTRDGRVFPGISEGIFYRQWGHLMESAELEDLTSHDLRHDFASVAAATTGNIHLVSALLGHRSLASTERYAHLFADPQKEAMDKIAAEYDIGLEEADVLEGGWK